MQVSVERTGPCEAKVSFTVPRAEFEGEMRQQLRTAGRNVRMKGFRPGKVPPKVLEKHFGDSAKQRTLEIFFNRALQKAVKDEELDPVMHERIAIDSIEVPAEGDFSHSFDVDLRPDLELVPYKGLEVESELAPVLDEELDATLADLKRQRSRPEAAGEDGLEESGMALAKLTWVKDGETIFEREGLRLSPLDQLPGLEPDAWKSAVLGKKKGEVVELPMTVPPDFEREDARGAAAVCRIEIQDAFRMVPPTDEELQELLKVDGPEALRDEIKKKIGEAKEARERSRVESVLLERILSEQEMELPGRMLEAQIASRKHALEHELEGQGLTKEEVAAEIERQDEEIRATVARGLKAYFLIQAIGNAETIRVENQDLVQELQSIAARNQATFEEVRDYYREQGLVEQVAVELLERKVRSFLRENARITEPA